MKSINKTYLYGRIGADAELRTFDNGVKKARFSIATSESYTNQNGEKVENTEWHNVIAFGKMAEIVEKYCKKGLRCIVEGKLNYGKYKDKNGVERYTTDIILQDLIMVDYAETNDSAKLAPQPAPANIPPSPDDDLPF